MSFLDRLLGQRPGAPIFTDQTAQTFVVPERAFINTHAISSAGLRRGQWVMSAFGIAILTGARIDGLAEVTLQKPDGTTMMELDESDRAVPAVRFADMANLRAAHIEEIPASRHEGADHLRSFGYLNASEA